jgi:hypothetical protein
MNLWIFLMGLVFWWMQNDYFGWNWKPKSEAELVCDGIVILVWALAVAKGPSLD